MPLGSWIWSSYCVWDHRVAASGLDMCPDSAEVVVGTWVEPCSASLLARSGLSDKATLELLTFVDDMIPLVMSPVENGSCEA